MTTLTLEFQLEESLAYAYKAAQPQEKEDVKRLFERLLSVKFRKQAMTTMFKNMESIGKEAEANDLTEDSINAILAELNVPKKTPKIRVQFEKLFEKWLSETAMLSSGKAIVSHAAYTQIIGMGDAVIPFILMQLQKNPHHLFFALYEITGENPVPFAHAGDLEKMTADWLDWGYKKGYLN